MNIHNYKNMVIFPKKYTHENQKMSRVCQKQRLDIKGNKIFYEAAATKTNLDMEEAEPI